MALETLWNVNEIDEFTVSHIEDEWGGEPLGYVVINHKNNNISFKIQNGPIKEVGLNGCQVDTLIEAAKLIIEGLNKNFPCEENRAVIFHLDQALVGLDFRRSNRVIRGVEGTNRS